MNQPLAYMDGETLMNTVLPPIRFVISQLLPQGLHVLAGAPKVGKSWLSLWLCLQVAQGEPAWEFPTTQGDVLYLCLEDSYSRIQNRLLDITDDAPSNLFFATMSERLHSGLEQQIERFLISHPDTALIVIDTLQRIRGGVNDANPYASDYRDLGILKELADGLDRFVGERYKPNVLMKKLLRCQQELLEARITLSTRRTHDRRELTLRVGCVSNDGKNDTGPVSDLPSQPSQLSQKNSAANPAKRIAAEKDERQSE